MFLSTIAKGNLLRSNRGYRVRLPTLNIKGKHFSLQRSFGWIYTMKHIPTSDWQKQYDTLLSPLAVKHTYGLGRMHPDAEYLDRFRFEVDTNRIRFSTAAFKRLQGKQQVFRAGTDECVQTRMTHSERVAAISASTCRLLGLNADLGYAIGLAHDLGHTPFGHAGQDALNTCIPFEHNEQSYRIVTAIEPQNLNIEVLEGILKHHAPGQTATLPRSHSLEAQITNLADSITYRAHDTEDGLTMGILTMQHIAQTGLGKKALDHPKGIWRGIIQILLDDLVQTYAQRTAELHLHNIDDVYRCKEPVVQFSPTIHALCKEYDAFMYNTLYMHPRLHEQSKEGAECIITLFHQLHKTPTAPVLALEERFMYSRNEALRDYLSSLTDQAALELTRRL